MATSLAYTADEQLTRFEKLPVKMLSKVLWAKAGSIVERERGPRPVLNLGRLATTEFPSFASVSVASAELDKLSAALDWDRAKRDTFHHLADLEGYTVADHGLVRRAERGL